MLGSDRLAAPGAFRMALAFAVFVHHTTRFNLGMSAVLIFFVLSGYWVATMWRQTYSQTTAAYLTFIVSRAWRIVPVFALCSGIAWALLIARGAMPDEAGRLAHQLFSNILILGYNSLPFQANIPGWSLDVEMQFYLIAPVVIFFIARNVYLLAGAMLISMLSQGHGASTVGPFILFFAVGVASAVHNLAPSRALAYRSLFATLGVLFVSGLLLIKDTALGDVNDAALIAFGSKTSLLIAVMMVPWALYTTRQKSGAPDRMWGDLSYIFYLLHWSVLGAMHTGDGDYGERLLLCTAAFALILGASYLVWRYFDRPIGKLRAAWVAGRRMPAAAPFAAAA